MKLNRIMSKSLWFFSLVVWACSLSLSAQTSSGGSTLRGLVEDELGGILPGAKVTIVLPGGKTRVVTTAADGTFSIPNVNAGVYNFFVQIQGFQPFVVSDLKMPHEEALTVTLVPASVEEATDIVAEAAGVSVEPDQNLTATVLGEDFIKDLPNNEDDLRDVLQALAGPGAGAGSGGQSGAEIMVNGFRGGRLPPKEAIMRITINQNPYSAEFSQPGFGRIEIMTKPGNDNWRGSINTSFRNSALDARNAFALTKPDMNQQQFGFNLSGPLIKKKMSFFANMDRTNFGGGSNTNAIIPTGPFVANVLAPNDSTRFSVRVDYLINQKNTLGVSYNRSQRNNENQEFAVSFGGGFGFGGRGGGGGGFGGGGAGGSVNFTLPERGTDSASASNDLQFIGTTILSSRLINEARLRMGYDTRNAAARTQGVAINVLDAFNGGGSTTGINNTRQFDYEIQDYLTYTLKKHTLKGGFQTQYNKQYSFSLSNFNGTYTFPSLGEYCRIANVTCAPGLSTTGRGIYQFTANTGAPVIRYGQHESSWFVNDDIRVSPTFTLSLGLRHEFQTNLPDKNNLAPRLGIAWSPFKDKKTTFRAGAGIFYQRLNDSQYGQTLRFDGSTQVSYVIQNPIFNPNYTPGAPLPGVASQNVQNTNITILDPNMKAPYSYNYNGSVERQLPFGLVGSVNLLYSKSNHVFRTRNINAPRLELLPLTPSGNINDTRPNPLKGNITQIEASAQSEFKAMFVRLDRRMGRNFSFFANYSLTDIQSDAGLPANNYDLRSEWGPVANRHSFFVMGRISLPKGIGLNPMVSVRSGSPYNITLGQDANRDTSFNDRPVGLTRNADLPASLYSQVIGCRSVSPTSPGTCLQTFADYLTQNYPNGIRAIGPGNVSVNLNLSKTFGFGKRDASAASGGMGGGGGRGGGGRGDGGRGGMGGPMGGMMGGGGRGGAEGSRYSLQLQAQVTNILNKVNFGQYGGTLTSPYFGIANSSAPGRQIELSARFSF